VESAIAQTSHNISLANPNLETEEIYSEAFPACGRRRAVDPPATGFDERLATASNFSVAKC
jgi:hypothetical protein